MTYNGWRNYATWNVALWIGNDEGLYETAKGCRDYSDFAEGMADARPDPIGFETPDGVSWADSALDVAALDDLIREL
jgi:hypothetical protein